jgi:hypothetical protein
VLDGSNLPGDPMLAWGVIAASIIIALAPLLISKMRDRATPDKPDQTSAAPAPSSNPSLDASGHLLAQLVTDLQRRASDAEKKADEFEKRYYDEVTRLQQRLILVEAELATLRTENNQLKDRLMRG